MSQIHAHVGPSPIHPHKTCRSVNRRFSLQRTRGSSPQERVLRSPPWGYQQVTVSLVTHISLRHAPQRLCSSPGVVGGRSRAGGQLCTTLVAEQSIRGQGPLGTTSTGQSIRPFHLFIAPTVSRFSPVPFWNCFEFVFAMSRFSKRFAETELK